MRALSFGMLITFVLACSTTKIPTVTNKLNGTWAPYYQEIGGTVLPAAAFQKQTLVINDSTYTFTAESTDKGVVKYTGDKMDIYGKEGVNAGKHFTAIYKHENDELTICYNLKGDGYPGSFDTKGTGNFTSKFRRQ